MEALFARWARDRALQQIAPGAYAELSAIGARYTADLYHLDLALRIPGAFPADPDARTRAYHAAYARLWRYRARLAALNGIIARITAPRTPA